MANTDLQKTIDFSRKEPNTAAEYAPQHSSYHDMNNSVSIRDYNKMRTANSQDYASYHSTYMDEYNRRSHRYHGFPEHNFLKGRQPVTSKDAVIEPQAGTNIPYGENVPITQTEPRPYAGSLNERSSAEHRKFRRHQLEAEHDFNMYKEEKLRQLQMEREDKKRDMDMLVRYNPFGKPGGGAPLLEGTKLQKFIETPREADDEGLKFGRPGAGAPLRTDSGKLRTEVQGDPLIRFHQGKTLQAQQAIKESMRYVTKQEDGKQYQKQLDQQMAEKAIQDKEARIHELQAELDMMHHDPYGRPGAGAPNRLNRDTPTGQYRASPSHGEIWHPFGRAGHGAPLRDSQGNKVTVYGRPKKHGNVDEYPFKDNIQVSSRDGGAGAPIKTDGGTKAKLPITMRKNDYGDATIKEEIPGKQNSEEDQIWYPFGKAGAGAPIKDKNGNDVTTIYGRAHHERDSADERRKQRAAREYLNEIQLEMEEQRRNRENEKEYSRAPVGELARLIQEGQVGKPRRDPYTGVLRDHHLGMSDVTKQRVDWRSQKGDDSRTYHTVLSKAAEERYRQRELDKLKERQRSQMHQQAMDSFWGRPGGGAPNPAGARYHDANDAIHSPRRQYDAPQWEHTKDLSKVTATRTTTQDSPKVSPRASYDSQHRIKVRDTTNSTHKNQYEFDLPPESTKKSYKLLTPYAVA